MGTEIEFTDTKLDYVSVAAARRMDGLRLVLGRYPIPGPWREACKGLFYVKGIPYTPVVSANPGASDLAIGMEGTQSELFEWSAQASAPVAIWNDERPRSLWIDQLNLAERLAPEPPLVPDAMEDRRRMFGLCNELMGENGLVWAKRLIMCDGPLSSMPADDEQRPFWEHLAAKYGYTRAGGAAAAAQIAAIVAAIDAQLRDQRERGSQFLIGDRLSALDIYWAAACGILHPMEPERCPMATAFRGVYGNDDPAIAAALSDGLVAHRDFIYAEYLELPIVF